MEGPIATQWRRDAAWAIVVIVAAALFLLEATARVLRAVGPEGREPPPDSVSLTVFFVLVQYMVPLFFVGGGLLCLYAGAGAAGIRIFPRREEMPTTWNLWNVARGAGVAYLVAYLAVLVLAQAFKGKSAEPFLVMANGYLVHLALLVFAVWFATSSGGSAGALGFTLKSWLGNLTHGVLSYVAALPVFYVAFLATALLMAALRIRVQPSPLIPVLREAQSPWLKWGAILLATVFGPFAEEVFFRGYLYQAMRRRLPAVSAIVINGALFSFIHLSAATFLPIMVLGMSMAYLFEKTRSLVACTTFHIAHNTFLVAMLYYVYALN